MCQSGSLVRGTQLTLSQKRHPPGGRPTALVRHLGMCDDHDIPIADHVPFGDGVRVRLGVNFTRVD
jgi:hypothetical protein